MTSPDMTPATSGSGRGSSNALTIVLVGAMLVAAVGVSFAVGRASSSSTSGAGDQVPAGGGVVPGGPAGDDGRGGLLAGGGPGRGFGPGGLTGTVTAVGADSMTVELANGQTVTYGLDGSTTYHQEVAASASDVTPGATVQVDMGQGFRPDQVSRGDDGTITLGTAGDVTVLP